jgi:hypothetical protein
MTRFPKLLNFILFQVCWFSCVLSGASGHTKIGVIVALLVGGLQIASSKNRLNEFSFLLLACVLGTALDLIPMKYGMFSFVNPAAVPWGYPLWMSGLWLGFASTFRSSLSWLSGRYLLAAVFGFIGGPIAYFAGEKLGGIVLGADTSISLLVIGLFWAIVTPGLFMLSERLQRI